MTRVATCVVRHNDQLAEPGYEKVRELKHTKHCSLSDTGQWTNQNVVYTRAVPDMFPIAKAMKRGRRPTTNAPGADRIGGPHHHRGRSRANAAARRNNGAIRSRPEQWLKNHHRHYDGSDKNGTGDPQLTYEARRHLTHSPASAGCMGFVLR